jgi:hypothetical protein
MPWSPKKQWVNICPYPGKKDILPVPPEVKHTKPVKNMGIVDVNRRGT